MLLRLSFISSKENNSVEKSIKKKQGYISKYNLIREKKSYFVDDFEWKYDII